jgi:hypothetical protein
MNLIITVFNILSDIIMPTVGYYDYHISVFGIVLLPPHEFVIPSNCH